MHDSIQFSEAVSELLSSENKNKSFGEVSEELNDYLIIIKEAVENGKITYAALRNEISKHLTSEDEAIPGSLAQLLLGCVKENGSCHFEPTVNQEIPFVYDNNYNKIFPLSKKNKPRSENDYAVLYFTGLPDNLDIETLKYLEDNGFNKLKIEYKNIDGSKYKTIHIENLKRYIYSKPEGNEDSLIYIIGIIFILTLFYLLTKS